jgi:hypothetical protein
MPVPTTADSVVLMLAGGGTHADCSVGGSTTALSAELDQAPAPMMQAL